MGWKWGVRKIMFCVHFIPPKTLRGALNAKAKNRNLLKSCYTFLNTYHKTWGSTSGKKRRKYFQVPGNTLKNACHKSRSSLIYLPNSPLVQLWWNLVTIFNTCSFWHSVVPQSLWDLFVGLREVLNLKFSDLFLNRGSQVIGKFFSLNQSLRIIHRALSDGDFLISRMDFFLIFPKWDWRSFLCFDLKKIASVGKKHMCWEIIYLYHDCTCLKQNQEIYER